MNTMRIGGVCREKQGQVARQGRIMVCCEIQVAAVARRYLLLLNSLILWAFLDWREYESPSARLDFSHQNRNGTILRAQNLQAIPDRDEIFVLNFRKSN